LVWSNRRSGRSWRWRLASPDQALIILVDDEPSEGEFFPYATQDDIVKPDFDTGKYI
jgi:hypothetical protein